MILGSLQSGLGTCWINFATFIESEEIIQKLNILKYYEIVVPIIVGYPTNIPQAPKKLFRGIYNS